MHQSSFDKMKKFKEIYLDVSRHLKILDVGSFDVNGNYADLFKEEKWTYYGADMAGGKNVDILLTSPYDWNCIADNSYDIVVSGQAYEHIEYFWITILQINRVLKVGGLCCIIAPAGGPEHSYPTDCWRYYPDGLKTVAKWGKMKVLEASTQWQSENYADGSDQWKDSMLVCIKTEETPHLKTILDTLNAWLGTTSIRPDLNINHDLIDQSNTNLRSENQIFEEMLQRRIIANEMTYPRWFQAITYLMKVYSERPDLQIAFPKLANNCDLSDLINWAKEYGINEDSRLSTYADFYKRYHNQSTAKNIHKN